MAIRVAILNQKGGVGKTTVSLGLASAAWSRGLRTLVVDLDAQANATYSLGVEPSGDYWGTGDALAANKAGAAKDMIVPSGWGDSVWLLPASRDLTDRETEVNRKGAEQRLNRALEGVDDDFDLVIIDCPPSLGLNTENALVAANAALVVVEPTVFGIRGVSPVLDLIETVWQTGNSGLELAGIILNRVPAVSTDAQRRTIELTKLVGAKAVWAPAIPLRVAINEAHGERSPLHAMGRGAGELPSVFDAHLGQTDAETRLGILASLPEVFRVGLAAPSAPSWTSPAF